MYSSRRASRILAATGLALCCLPAFADSGAFVVGAGIEADSEDGLAVTVLGDVAIAENTWLSAAAARSTVDVPRRDDTSTWYGDLSVDRFFEPAGVRLGVAYWGDSDVLDSTDARLSVYSRGENSYLSIDGERREFDLVVPPLGPFPGSERSFGANGLGLSGRLNLNDDVSLRASGMSYEYDVDLDVAETDRVAALLTVSRLSLLSSLIDWRASVGLDVDFGLSRLSFNVSRWRGAIDDGDNYGATIAYLAPVSRRADVEVSVGYDDSDLFGDVTIVSVFVYFYGGD